MDNLGYDSGEEKTYGGSTACAAHDIDVIFDNVLELDRLRGDVGDAAALRATQTKSMNWSGPITTANALVEASIVVSEFPKEGEHRIVLVSLARKEV